MNLVGNPIFVGSSPWLCQHGLEFLGEGAVFGLQLGLLGWRDCFPCLSALNHLIDLLRDSIDIVARLFEEIVVHVECRKGVCKDIVQCLLIGSEGGHILARIVIDPHLDVWFGGGFPSEFGDFALDKGSRETPEDGAVVLVQRQHHVLNVGLYGLTVPVLVGSLLLSEQPILEGPLLLRHCIEVEGIQFSRDLLHVLAYFPEFAGCKHLLMGSEQGMDFSTLFLGLLMCCLRIDALDLVLNFGHFPKHILARVHDFFLYCSMYIKIVWTTSLTTF
jgi:hypothetical protein